MRSDRVLSAREALQRSADNLVVTKGATIEFEPEGREYAEYFSHIELQTFEDLQLLGFVPRGLAEDDVRNAIKSDDDQAYQLAVAAVGTAARGCRCAHEGGRDNPGSPPDQLAKLYSQLRKSNNPSLAAVLSRHYKTRLSFDDPLPRLVGNWVTHFDRIRRVNPHIYVAIVEDVTINRNAVLITSRKAKAFLCRNLWIHRFGELRQRGSYMRLWANKISQFIDLSDVASDSIGAPWQLET